MKKIFRVFMLLALMLISSANVNAQGMVVIMDGSYSCEDPRNDGETWTFKKGDALLVYNGDGNGYEYSGPYTAASVEIPKNKCHIPGEHGEKYIVINVNDLNLREGPSTRHKIYCYDEEYAGSIDPSKFLANPRRELGVYGNSYSWRAYHLPKGTCLPYLGKENGFYKTTFDGTVFYVCARYCSLR